jgi:hypothetical protein
MRQNWKLVLVCLEIVLTLTQYRFTVCSEHTMVLETIFDAPDGTLGDFGDVESCFSPF